MICTLAIPDLISRMPYACWRLPYSSGQETLEVPCGPLTSTPNPLPATLTGNDGVLPGCTPSTRALRYHTFLLASYCLKPSWPWPYPCPTVGFGSVPWVADQATAASTRVLCARFGSSLSGAIALGLSWSCCWYQSNSLAAVFSASTRCPCAPTSSQSAQQTSVVADRHHRCEAANPLECAPDVHGAHTR